MSPICQARVTQIITRTICLREEINWNVCLEKVKQFDKRLEAAHAEKTFYFNREFWTLRPSQERSHLPAGSVCYNCFIIYMMLISPGDRRLGKYHQKFSSSLDMTNWQQVAALSFWRGFNLSQLLQFWKFFRSWMRVADRPGNYKKHIKRGTLRTTAAIKFYLTSRPQGKRAITLSSREVTNNLKQV